MVDHRGMRHQSRGNTLAGVVVGIALSLAVAPGQAVADADPQGHPAAMVTDERGCWELNTVRNASAAAVQRALPDGWQPQRNRAGAALTLFVDYVCEEFSIDGLPPRRTIVSWLAALALNPATGERRTWTLSHGSDNPLYVQRLRKLGVDSRYLPRSTAAIERVDATTSAFEMRYVDDTGAHGLDYVRSGTAPEPAGEPVTSPGGVSWMRTTGGESVRVAYLNTVLPTTTPTVTETFSAGSIPAGFGIEDIHARTARGLQVFMRGSWTGELTKEAG